VNRVEGVIWFGDYILFEAAFVDEVLKNYSGDVINGTPAMGGFILVVYLPVIKNPIE